MVQVLNRGSSRVQRRSEARRTEILRAASRVFRRRGLAAAGMREIAEEADPLYFTFKFFLFLYIYENKIS